MSSANVVTLWLNFSNSSNRKNLRLDTISLQFKRHVLPLAAPARESENLEQGSLENWAGRGSWAQRFSREPRITGWSLWGISSGIYSWSLFHQTCCWWRESRKCVLTKCPCQLSPLISMSLWHGSTSSTQQYMYVGNVPRADFPLQFVSDPILSPLLPVPRNHCKRRGQASQHFWLFSWCKWLFTLDKELFERLTRAESTLANQPPCDPNLTLLGREGKTCSNV